MIKTRHTEITARIKGHLDLIKQRGYPREMKLRCCKELKITETTLSNYLRCKHLKVEIALKIIDFFEPLEDIDFNKALITDIL